MAQRLPRLPTSQDAFRVLLKGLLIFLGTLASAGVGDHPFLPSLECWGAHPSNLPDAQDPWQRDTATGPSS